MSNAISALQDVVYSGLVDVSEQSLVGMVTLKADLSARATATAVKAATGLKMPKARRVELDGPFNAVAWMAPDEVLIVCDHNKADEIVSTLEEKLGKADHLAVNVSDARAVFTLSGGPVRDVLGKLTPADLGALDLNEMRRTRFAQIAAAFWMPGEDQATLICFRSVAQYMFDLLANAARDGTEVGFH